MISTGAGFSPPKHRCDYRPTLTLPATWSTVLSTANITVINNLEVYSVDFQVSTAKDMDDQKS
jgi:hypothetical protein